MAGPIAHLDLDAFYASVELQRRPELRGLPVIVAGSGPRAVVTTASYEARRFGIGSAMPASQARRLCPDAVVIPPDFEAYRATSRAVMEILRAHVERSSSSAWTRPTSTSTGLVVAEGGDAPARRRDPRADGHERVDRHRPEQARREGRLRRREAGAASSCSRASRPARGSRRRRRSLVPGHRPADRRAARRARASRRSRARARPTRRVLAEAFGARQGPWLRRRARFEGSADVEPVREAVSESRETTFDYDIADAARLEAILLRAHGAGCATACGVTSGAGARSGSRSASPTSRR